jgi:alpha-amylase
MKAYKCFLLFSLMILSFCFQGDDLGSHFATNPNGQVGLEKTINIDGSPSDWDLSMKIAQNIANNDPRVFAHWSMHEIAMDDYALYAAYDDDYLYLMWEMINLSDIVADEDFPKTQGNLWIYNLPIFIFLSTQKGRGNGGTMVGGGTIWGSGISLEEKVDVIIACSTNGANGPFIYHYDEELDAFPPETEDKGPSSGITLKWGNGILDSEVFGLKAVGADNRNIDMDYDDSSDWIDFYSSTEHNKQLDMTYEMSIPLSKLGLTKEKIKNEGIGIIKVSTFGTSGMDSLPYDKSMSDNAAKPYSKDPSTSMEKEDEDHITCKLARIGGTV